MSLTGVLVFAEGFRETTEYVEAYLDLEALASDPYSRFVYGESAREVARALLTAGAGEFAPPFGQLLVDETTRDPLGMIAGPLQRAELTRARFKAARTLMGHPALADGGVIERSRAAQAALLTLEEGDAYLSRIAVHPERRGQKIGIRLLEEFIARARAGGAKRAVLEVSPQHREANALYERFGFGPRADRAGRADHRVEAAGRVLEYRHLAMPL